VTLDELLTSLEEKGGLATPDTSCNPTGVSVKPPQTGTCTPDTLDTPQNDNEGNDNGKALNLAPAASCWWRFHYADRHSKEACYCPPASQDHALAGEPDAITAEAFEPVLQEPDEPLSEKDKAVIRSLLADIGEDDEGIALALEKCRTNQDARDAFLKLAKQWQGGSRVE
jgi:hypothetical protein